MNKYIVKNCPALMWGRRTFKCCAEYPDHKKCEEKKDCLTKQIIEICKKDVFLNSKKENADEYFQQGFKTCQREILNLIDTEEIEE